MGPAPSGLSFDEQARHLVRDLHQPNPAIYWTDMLGSALVGWTAFAAGLRLTRPFATVALLIAALCFYRGLCFIHELTHLRASLMPGFETAWNLLFGVPLLLPSFVYVGVHQDHHKLSTYGTKQDPEYLPFAENSLMTVTFALHSVLIPALLFLRFLVLAPVSLFSRPLRRALAVHASALSMNFGYRREPTPALMRSIWKWEMVILVAWGIPLALMTYGALPWSILATWYATAATASLINAVRTLAAHRYESGGVQVGREEQLLDSIDTPGSVWTELWAPVGLRYHALHHYFPGIPYHNLAEAHGRLITGLPPGAPYLQVQSTGLFPSLARLIRSGRSMRRLPMS